MEGERGEPKNVQTKSQPGGATSQNCPEIHLAAFHMLYIYMYEGIVLQKVLLLAIAHSH